MLRDAAQGQMGVYLIRSLQIFFVLELLGAPRPSSLKKTFFLPESSARWLDDGHKKFSTLAILAKVIKVQKIVQICHSGGDLGQV